MLSPGIVGMRGSMAIRLRPAMHDIEYIRAPPTSSAGLGMIGALASLVRSLDIQVSRFIQYFRLIGFAETDLNPVGFFAPIMRSVNPRI